MTDSPSQPKANFISLQCSGRQGGVHTVVLLVMNLPVKKDFQKIIDIAVVLINQLQAVSLFICFYNGWQLIHLFVLNKCFFLAGFTLIFRKGFLDFLENIEGGNS
jgi:hypothetical protein